MTEPPVETARQVIANLAYYQVVDAAVAVETERQSFTFDAVECEGGDGTESTHGRPWLSRGAGTIYAEADGDVWLDEPGATPDPVVAFEVTAHV